MGRGGIAHGGTTLDVFCFEKGRSIPESMKKGASEILSYAGMASPSVRKQLVLSSGQYRVDRLISKELKRLGVPSRTSALAHVFEHEGIRATIDYYVSNSKHVLRENKGASGMIVKSGDGRILCADVYSSPSLFAKMFPQLMQSAALEVCKKRRARRRSAEGDVKEFLSAMKESQTWKRRSSQTHRFLSPTLVGQAMLYSDPTGTKVVHLEAYPRR